ncbi:MAG: DUF933 domain-containing protein [Chloroflexota bacterium]
MKIALVGLPSSGKSTLFAALTGGKGHGIGQGSAVASRLGVARVPEPRLQTLERIFHPRKTIPAEVQYVDTVTGPIESGTRTELPGELLNYLMSADELLHVVRAFADERVPHPESTVDPVRDIATFDLELTFSDLAIVDRRLRRLGDSLKGAKGTERDHLQQEEALLHRVREGLEHEVPIRKQDISSHELKELSNYQFLTAKPVLVVLNIDEAQVPDGPALEGTVHAQYPDFPVVASCAKLELELQQLSPAEAEEFREALGLESSSLDTILRRSFEELGLITFFTTASDQLQAWNLLRGNTAVKAAAKVHSDMERGFIRAEVVAFSDIERYGSMAEARRHGVLRSEGRDYVVQDGDIITFLFNV